MRLQIFEGASFFSKSDRVPMTPHRRAAWEPQAAIPDILVVILWSMVGLVCSAGAMSVFDGAAGEGALSVALATLG
jgi:hypothetical protein